MSTSASIKITDECEDLYFYRHCDGYPEGVLPTLNKFLDWVKEGRIRDIAGQAAPWLIIIGAREFHGSIHEEPLEPDLYSWKVGSYELAGPEIMQDACDYHYVVNIKTQEIEGYEVDFDEEENIELHPVNVRDWIHKPLEW